MYKGSVDCRTFACGVAFLKPAAAPASGLPAGNYEYLGTKTCTKCHVDIWKSRAKAKMANRFQVLRPNAELKPKPGEKVGLTDARIAQIKASKTKGEPRVEPDKPYARQAHCLKGHTAGERQSGGCAIPNAKDKKGRRKADPLEAVTGESCHGPGSAFVKIFDDIQEKQRPYTRAGLVANTMYKVAPEPSTHCQNKDSPRAGDGQVLDFEKREDEGTHTRAVPKLR